jgi:hypothetical protein
MRRRWSLGRIAWVGLVLVMLCFVAGCSVESGGAFRLIKWHRRGGIAGLEQGLAVASSGAVQAQRSGRTGAQAQLDPAEMAQLRRLLADVDPDEIETVYRDSQVADAIFEGVAVQVGQGEWRTEVGTGAQAPPQVTDLLRFLGRLYERYQPRAS